MNTLSVIALLPATQEEAESFIALTKRDLLTKTEINGSGLSHNLVWGLAALAKLMEEKDIAIYVNSKF